MADVYRFIMTTVVSSPSVFKKMHNNQAAFCEAVWANIITDTKTGQRWMQGSPYGFTADIVGDYERLMTKILPNYSGELFPVESHWNDPPQYGTEPDPAHPFSKWVI